MFKIKFQDEIDDFHSSIDPGVGILLCRCFRSKSSFILWVSRGLNPT